MYFNSYEFGIRVQELRRSRGMTQEELAAKLNVESQHVSRMERGVNTCSVDVLVELSVVLHTTTDYLLMGNDAGRQHIKDEILTIINQLAVIAKQI